MYSKLPSQAFSRRGSSQEERGGPERNEVEEAFYFAHFELVGTAIMAPDCVSNFK